MEKVVITGMGVISPIGGTLAEFEESLFAGRHGIAPIEHFDLGDMTTKVHAPVKDYDPARYFSEREAHRMDTYSQYGMIAAREAVAASGVLDGVDPYRIGVYMTTSFGGTGTLLGEYDTLLEKGAGKVSPLTVPRFYGNILSGLVAIDTGARGPAAAHLAACASSALSIGEAMRAIRHGYVDAMICGGAEASTQKLVVAGFQNLRALTAESDPDRACVPFDKDRSGFVMGEGGAALVLESESHARARGAQILAEVSGYALTDDAAHMTAPAMHGESADRVITDALADAGPSDDTLYVNAHGTSTIKNDKLESAAIARTLGGKAVVSSTKSMTGHLLGVAGAIEAVASVLALRRQTVPATVGTRELDPDVQVDVVHGAARSMEFSRALSLSLGFGGHNAALVIDRAS
ncbi:beta-ketoacyl-ACP synthase II [Myceligenerans crystallogenes]|uniref:Beta-ketoacyl-ACP synthase II n=1 Tax=Myceligenerans crystallogenes TaxID=316335 RepID=A0ABN2N1V3_9MICO